MSWDFRGAHIDRSAMGPHARVDNRDSVAAWRADVLTSLDGVRGDLPVVETDAGRRVELADLLDGLAHDVEAGAAPTTLHDRWQRIRSLLSPALQTTANVAQITGLFVQLLHS